MKTKVIPFAVAVKVQTYKVVCSPVDGEGSYLVIKDLLLKNKKQSKLITRKTRCEICRSVFAGNYQ